MNVLDRFIETLEPCETKEHRNLAIQFLRGPCMGLNIANYDEALDRKTLNVSEVEGGHVPELKFTNSGDCPVFVPEGTIITGLRQSRSVRVSFLISQQEELIIPVHCIEQGRWTAISKFGQRSPFHLHSKLRAANLRHSHNALKGRKDLDSGESQQDTWENIRGFKTSKEKTLKRDINSPDGFLGDVYREDKANIEPYLASLPCPDGAIGFVSLVERHVVSLEVFGDERLLRKNYQALLSGIAIEATDEESLVDIRNRGKQAVADFLRGILAAKKESYKSVWHGNDVRFEGGAFVGYGLVDDGRVLHLEAFAV
ncbi:MAG TPA: DUF6569 family protein [Thermodesulfovibrionales bacterium]|nr:DUF6569 family protein [Thermodesulfovibrionales bacterium]